jgi:hypothetical protein
MSQIKISYLSFILLDDERSPETFDIDHSNCGIILKYTDMGLVEIINTTSEVTHNPLSVNLKGLSHEIFRFFLS